MSSNNFKRDFGLTKPQCIMLVAARRYIEWHAIFIENPENYGILDRLIWSNTGAGSGSYRKNLPHRTYKCDIFLSAQPHVVRSLIRMAHCEVPSAVQVLYSLEKLGLTKRTKEKWGKKPYWQLTNFGNIAAINLDMSLSRMGLFEPWKLPQAEIKV